jgi:hypothetical protein
VRDADRIEANERFEAFCARRGIDPRVARRPNLWWLQPRDFWKPDWREHEVPKGERPNRRTLAERLAAHARATEGKR